MAGAGVYVAETNEEVWDSARAAGVKGVAKSIAELGDDFDVIIDYAGFGTTTAAAIENVRVGGRVVQVGMGRPSRRRLPVTPLMCSAPLVQPHQAWPVTDAPQCS